MTEVTNAGAGPHGPGSPQSMAGKTVLITGASRGIGREAASALAGEGAEVVMACRDLAGAGPVCEAIRRGTGSTRVETMSLDLASLPSIRRFADLFSREHPRLDVLVNNAGVFRMKREETGDGLEMTMGTNYLGPFLLTNLLLPVIKRTPGARIINVSSDACSRGKIDLSDLNLRGKYGGMKAYASSKLAVLLFTQELAERLKDTGVTVNALHPGHVATGIWSIWPENRWYQKLLNMVVRRVMISPREGAETIIYLASSDDVEGVTGSYFDKGRPRDVPPACRDSHLRAELWRVSEKLTGLA